MIQFSVFDIFIFYTISPLLHGCNIPANIKKLRIG